MFRASACTGQPSGSSPPLSTGSSNFAANPSVASPVLSALHGRMCRIPGETVDSVLPGKPFREAVLVLPPTLCQVRGNASAQRPVSLAGEDLYAGNFFRVAGRVGHTAGFAPYAFEGSPGPAPRFRRRPERRNVDTYPLSSLRERAGVRACPVRQTWRLRRISSSSNLLPKETHNPVGRPVVVPSQNAIVLSSPAINFWMSSVYVMLTKIIGRFTTGFGPSSYRPICFPVGAEGST